VSTRAQSHTIDGVTLQLSHPVELPIEWVGREELKLQLLAAWLVLADEDVPLTPRLTGKPGVGKTTLGYAVARSLGREVYLLQATTCASAKGTFWRRIAASSSASGKSIQI
jgi:replication-associated recombination protein RarA